jgi:hypothetical protein
MMSSVATFWAGVFCIYTCRPAYESTKIATTSALMPQAITIRGFWPLARHSPVMMPQTL